MKILMKMAKNYFLWQLYIADRDTFMFLFLLFILIDRLIKFWHIYQLRRR